MDIAFSPLMKRMNDGMNDLMMHQSSPKYEINEDGDKVQLAIKRRVFIC